MKPDRPERLKRFYRRVSVEGTRPLWRVHLDGRTLRTPAGSTLAVPSLALAEAIASEWERQEDTVDIVGMHLTRLANVAIDRTPVTRSELIEEIVRYCETDLLCFLSDEADVRDRQEAVWRPVRDWAARKLDVLLVPVQGLLAAPQPSASLEAARSVATKQDDFSLTGLAFGCGLYGSSLLVFAVERGERTADAAFEASILDEIIQAERWGRDEEAEAARAAKRTESAALGLWFRSLRAD